MEDTTKRLIGKDGKIYTCTKGAEVTGNGTTPLGTGYYVATHIATSGSGLPTGLQTKYVFKGNASIIPAATEKVIPLTFKEMGDAQSSSLDFKADEIDVTTLADKVKTYRAGYTDISGSLTGVMTLNVSETLVNRFMPTVVQTAAGTSVTISEINGETIYLITEVNSESVNSEPIAMFVTPIVLTSYKAGAKTADAQTYDASYRVTPDDEIEACFLEIEQA